MSDHAHEKLLGNQLITDAVPRDIDLCVELSRTLLRLGYERDAERRTSTAFLRLAPAVGEYTRKDTGDTFAFHRMTTKAGDMPKLWRGSLVCTCCKADVADRVYLVSRHEWNRLKLRTAKTVRLCSPACLAAWTMNPEAFMGEEPDGT